MDDAELRAAFGKSTPEEWRRLCRERELEHWRETNRFCGRCGAATERHADPAENAMVCPKCGRAAYPQLTPAVIVLVRKGREILLQRNSHYRLPHWSLVAGFAEPGESLEEAARREIREEAGVEVGELEYFGSQTWPFPSGMMIGYVAEWVGGELRPDGEEVVESGWFGRENLPPLPGEVSLARRLIDAWLEADGKTTNQRKGSGR